MKRLPGQSQLDYLWVNFGERFITESLDELDNKAIPSNKIVKEAITSLQNRSLGSIQMSDGKLVIKSVDGELISEIAIPSAISVSDFGSRAITQDDIDNGCTLSKGTLVHYLTLSTGVEYLAPVLKVTETASIKNRLVDGILYSDVKLDSNPESIQLAISNGLKADIPLNGTPYRVLFKALTQREYDNITPDAGTLYFIKNSSKLYLGSQPYGGSSSVKVVEELPEIGDPTQLYIKKDNNALYVYIDDTWVCISSSSEGGAEVENIKAQITSIETNLDALQAAQASDFAIRKIKVDTTEQTASNGKETLEFASGDHITLNLENGVVTVGTDIVPQDLTLVEGVSTTDKVLSLDNKKLSATISLSIDSEAGEDGKKYIRLTGKDNADLGKVDISSFVKDGLLDNASFNTDTKILTLTFNTSAGKEPIDIDLTSLVDLYDGSNLKLKSIAIPSAPSEEPAATDSVDSAIANLIKRDRELTDGIDMMATGISDLVNNPFVAKGKDGDYVTTTITSKDPDNEKPYQKISVALTIKNIAEATSTDNGVALANDVKTYIDNLLTWEEGD